MKKVLLGNEAIVKGALEAGVNFVSGYPGCPAAEIGEEFLKISKVNGLYTEWSTNEKTALEAAIGASFSGLRSLVNMKSFGINVCSDSLFPLAYTGTKTAMVIVVGDDPSCWSSAQSEQDSRGYAYLSKIPMLEPSDPQECYEFTKLGFKISEKFNLPVILRTTTRVNHQKAIVEINHKPKTKNQKIAKFVKNPHQLCTIPPRVLEMKKELLGKIKKIRAYFEKLEINKIENLLGIRNCKLGIITSGVAYLHTKEALEEMGFGLPILKLGSFYPLPEEKIKNFIKRFKKVLVIEEIDPYLEKEVKMLAKEVNCKIEIFGKRDALAVLPAIGELDPEKIIIALSKILKLKIKNYLKTKNWKLEVPRRYPRLCKGCPHLFTLSILKKLAPQGIIFGGDIGCYMIAGYPPHNVQDYIFSMGAGVGISHGVKKSTKQKVITLIGDGTFFHAGIPALINCVYNKSNPLIIVLDNRTTAMTGHQTNPGVGKTGSGEITEELKIDEIAKACGVKNVKVVDPINVAELEATIKEFLEKDEVSLIISKRICALLAKRQAQQNG